MGNKNVTDQIIRIMEAKDDIKSAVMEAGVTVPEELSIDGYGDKVREISGNMNSRITAIEEKIPDNAASDNKLADKNFVSSSISNAISGIDLGKGVVAGDGTETSDPGDGTRKVSVKRDKSSESFLSVSVDGVKVSGIQTAISSAISGIETSLNKKQDTISDLETIRSNASSAYKWGDHSKAGYLKSVGDATITIKQDGTVKGSFTMNQTMDSEFDRHQHDIQQSYCRFRWYCGLSCDYGGEIHMEQQAGQDHKFKQTCIFTHKWNTINSYQGVTTDQ